MSDIMAPSSKSAKSGKGNTKKLSELMIGRMNLEMENKDMEERLEQLRLNMQKEREERHHSSGFLWRTGQAGSLTNPSQGPQQNKENSAKASPGKTKLKVLKDTIPGPVKQPVVPKPSFSVAIENPRTKGKSCGQCDDKNAMLTCFECGEDYCVNCFTKFHQKGALKHHRSTPMQIIPNQIGSLEAYPSSPGNLPLTSTVDNPIHGRHPPAGKLDLAELVKKEIERDLKKLDEKRDAEFELKKEALSRSLPNNSSPPGLAKSFSAESVSTSSTFPVDEKPSGGALLQGTFNEEESSESFKASLMDWRNEKPDYKTKHKVHETDPGRVDSPEGFTFSHLGGSHNLGHTLGRPMESLLTKPEHDFKFRSEISMKHDEEEKGKYMGFPLRSEIPMMRDEEEKTKYKGFPLRSEIPMKHDEEEKTKYKSFPMRLEFPLKHDEEEKTKYKGFPLRSEISMKHDEEEKTKYKGFPLRSQRLVFEGQRGSTEEFVESINGLRRMEQFESSNQKKSMQEMCHSIDTLGTNIGSLAKHLISMQNEQSYNSQLVSWAICRGIELLGLQNDFTNPKIHANMKREDLAAPKTKEPVKESSTRHASLPRHSRRAHGSSQVPISSHSSSKSKGGKRKKEKIY